MGATGRVLQRLVGLCCTRPWLTVSIGVLLAGLGFGHAARSLTLETSKFQLLPSNQRWATLYESYSRDFAQLEDIVVAVESPSVQMSAAYAARLAGALRDGDLHAARVTYRIDPRHLEAHGLLYLPLDEVQGLFDTLARQEELLTSFAAKPSLDRLVEGINQSTGDLFLPRVFGAEDERPPVDTSLLRDLLGQVSERLDHPVYRSPWKRLFSDRLSSAPDAGYFLSEDRRLLYVVVDFPGAPGQRLSEAEAIAAVRRVTTALRAEFPAVAAGVTGAPALFSDELATATSDTGAATTLALVLTLALLLLAFRRLLSSGLLLAALVISLGWSLGVVTLTVHHLNVFSMMFVSVVVGIGIDYGIYFLFRYDEERARGRDRSQAAALTAARSGPGILLGALTAAATFYLLTISDFRGIREFGFVAGTAILLAFVVMLTVFPAFLVLTDRRRRARHLVLVRTASREPDAWRDRLRHRIVPALRPSKGFALVILIPTGVALWAAPRVGFDYNLLNLQAPETESVVWEKKIAAAAGRSGFAALATAGSLEELRAKQAVFEALPSVADVRSALTMLPARQDEKLALLGRAAAIVDDVVVGAPPRLDVDALIEALEILHRRLHQAAMDIPREHRGDLAATAAMTSSLLQQLRERDRRLTEVALTDFQGRLAADFSDHWERLRHAIRPGPVTMADLPDVLQRKFVGASGRLLMQIHARDDIWERPGATRFVEELRSVDPEVTGQPVVAYESMRMMERACHQGIVYAFVLVAGIAALMIRRLRETLIAMVPLLLGTLWTVAVMRVTGLRFDLVNVWALPLIIGSAAEYGVNIVMRSLEARADGGPLLPRSTVLGVTFNGLTTMAGFGSLLLAHHQGVWGLGLLLVIGTAVTLAASLVVLPVLLQLSGARTRASQAADEEIVAAVLPRAS